MYGICQTRRKALSKLFSVGHKKHDHTTSQNTFSFLSCALQFVGKVTFISYCEPFRLLIVGVEGYCCPWSHSVTYTLGRTPLDEGSASRKDVWLATNNIHKRGTSMSPARFKPAIPGSEWPQTHALDSVATGIISMGNITLISSIFHKLTQHCDNTVFDD